MRSRIKLGLVGFVFVSLTSLCLAVETTASFKGLGDLPGGASWSQAYGVSSDGSCVVGQSESESGYEAFRWTADEGMVGLGDLPGSSFKSMATGVSANGSVVVGWSRTASGESGDDAFRWTASGGMVNLGQTKACGVSNDGLVVVGFGNIGGYYNWAKAFRWVSGTGMSLIGDLPGGKPHSVAYGVSANGLAVVGYSGSASGNEAFRWTVNDGWVGLGDLPGGSFKSFAHAVSADGRIVVGYGTSASGYEAFRWEDLNNNGQSDPDEMLTLGDLLGDSMAYAVSADGSVIVGRGYSGAFIWDATNGTRYLKDVLISDYGLDLTG